MRAPRAAEAVLPAEALAAAWAPAARGLRYLLRRFARNRMALAGSWVVLLIVFLAVFAAWIAPYNPIRPDFFNTLKPPSRQHLMGTDDLGRDVLSRVIFGTRTSLLAGVISVGIAVLAGLPLGLISGYYRGRLDDVLMRITDAMLSFPFLVLALALAAVLGAGLDKAMIAIGIVFMPGFIRLSRGQVLSEREQNYVEAARALGAGDGRIIRKHLLPNIISPVLVQASLSTAAAITAEAALSFLGLGTQPPTPSWGSMLNFAQPYLGTAPWMALYPGLAIFITVLALNLLGDGLREALDPRVR
ncbi:MAG: ABC transporter permease [Armatimonadota bacterium]|nr:ABC transporter permease [Armatimonadota bacterium]MDR7450677.1 ABC transporter permease [Armatimonadota bacterium]MDR7466033.1 ABC transporter permease [Armatimonadota bacterium]MDR7493930.1 ABC transporter permease [Armatimonadota bacterium]MDR7504035.1 ABC transporter permease [Armatimonadota bacterium]